MVPGSAQITPGFDFVRRSSKPLFRWIIQEFVIRQGLGVPWTEPVKSLDWENLGNGGYFEPGLGTKWTPDHMRFEVVFEAVISIPDIRYPEPNGAQYGPGLAFFDETVMPGCTELRIPAHGFGISPKIPLFLQNTANFCLRIRCSQTRLDGKSHVRSTITTDYRKEPPFWPFPGYTPVTICYRGQVFLYQRFHLPIAISENATMRDRFI